MGHTAYILVRGRQGAFIAALGTLVLIEVAPKLISGVTPSQVRCFSSALSSPCCYSAPRFGFCKQYGRNRVPSDYGASLD